MTSHDTAISLRKLEKNHPLLINTELQGSNEKINSRHRKRESAHFQAIHHRSLVQAAPPTDGLNWLDLFFSRHFRSIARSDRL